MTVNVDVDLFVQNRRSLRLKDGTVLEFKVLQSAAGYYIGTWLDGPYSRESLCYWDNEKDAQAALDSGKWLLNNF